MEETLRQADLMGIPRKEALYRIYHSYDLDDDIDWQDYHLWIREMENEFLRKDLKIHLGRWLKFITKRRYAKKENR